MTGTLVTLLREPGERVKKGDGLLVMEAMKMERTIASRRRPGVGTPLSTRRPGERQRGAIAFRYR